MPIIYRDEKGENLDPEEVDGNFRFLAENKQDNLTIDSTPTEGSTNPVSSGGVFDAIEGIQITVDSVPTDGSGNAVSSNGVFDALATKQDTLTIDSTPTDGSNNPVASNGVFDALATKQSTLSFDSTPTNGSTNPVTSDGIYDALALKQNLLDIVTPEMYGAVGDGVTNDYTAFANMITAAGTTKLIFIPAKTYLISTSLVMTPGQKMRGSGKNSILKTTSNITILNLDNNCTVEGVAFLGSFDYSTKVQTGIASQNGINITAKYSTLVTGCYFNNLGNIGYVGTSSGGIGFEYLGNKLTDCYMYNNYMAINTASGDYYTELTNVSACYNIYGCKLDGGNNRINGGSYSGNWKHGIWLPGTDGNEAHSSIIGVAINHNNAEASAAGTNFGLIIENVTLTHSILGCAIFSNDISITGSKGIVFEGCPMNFTWLYAGASNALFSNCTFLTNKPSLNDNQGSSGYSDIQFSNFRSVTNTLPIQTTNTTATTVFNYTVGTFEVKELDITVIAGSGNYVGAIMRRRYSLVRGSGSVALVRTVIVDDTDYIDASLAGITLSTTISTGTFNVQVNGLAATTIRWKACLNAENYHK